MIFKQNDDVVYMGKQTHIEEIHENGDYLIANPFWDWDDEAVCVENDVDYPVPYWLTVKPSELSKVTQ